MNITRPAWVRQLWAQRMSDVPCPRCLALEDEQCHSVSGNVIPWSKSHSARVEAEEALSDG